MRLVFQQISMNICIRGEEFQIKSNIGKQKDGMGTAPVPSFEFLVICSPLLTTSIPANQLERKELPYCMNCFVRKEASAVTSQGQ